MTNFRRAEKLTEFNKSEVLSFLNNRPGHTVVMTSFVRDNGIESEDNRGVFYGYRNDAGMLEGVALIGHTTLVETRSDSALKAFALAARTSEIPIHIMMADGEKIKIFWKYFAGDNRQPRLSSTELLFELNFPFPVPQCKWNIRLAVADELEQIAAAHAEVAFVESGVDPLIKDRTGFLKRTLKRIEQKRTFVVFENGNLIFKADVVAETDDVYYLEGIYTSPEMRGKGIGAQCLAKLSMKLLCLKQHICLLSNRDFKYAHRSYEKAGYKNTDSCTTIFV